MDSHLTNITGGDIFLKWPQYNLFHKTLGSHFISAFCSVVTYTHCRSLVHVPDQGFLI